MPKRKRSKLYEVGRQLTVRFCNTHILPQGAASSGKKARRDALELVGNWNASALAVCDGKHVVRARFNYHLELIGRPVRVLDNGQLEVKVLANNGTSWARGAFINIWTELHESGGPALGWPPRLSVRQVTMFPGVGLLSLTGCDFFSTDFVFENWGLWAEWSSKPPLAEWWAEGFRDHHVVPRMAATNLPCVLLEMIGDYVHIDFSFK